MVVDKNGQVRRTKSYAQCGSGKSDVEHQYRMFGAAYQKKISQPVGKLLRTGGFDFDQSVEESIILRGGTDPLVSKAVGVAFVEVFDPSTFCDNHNTGPEIGV